MNEHAFEPTLEDRLREDAAARLREALAKPSEAEELRQQVERLQGRNASLKVRNDNLRLLLEKSDNYRAYVKVLEQVERLTQERDRALATAAALRMSERCSDCSCELTDFGHGVGWRCQLCDAKDMLKEAREQLAEKDAAAAVLRKAIKAALGDGDQESEKVWRGRLRHEVAVQCKAAIATTDAGRSLYELVERVRQMECFTPNWCPQLPKERQCISCQFRAEGEIHA